MNTTTSMNRDGQVHLGAERRATFLRRFSFAAAFCAATLAMTSAAGAWWNDEWSMRKSIAIDTSSTGADITDPIGTTPLLVRLHVGNFRFAAAKPDGSDLRFVAGDDKRPLKHHIEKFDSLLGEALVWVSVPNVQPGAKASLWLYYGNPKAAPAADEKGTYDAETLLTYHFGEHGTPAQDSSVWANGAQTAGQPAEGAIIGSGLRLDGRTPVTIPASPSLALPDNAALTWSAWIKPAALQRNAAIYSRRDGRNGLVIGLDDGAPFVEYTVAGTVQRTTTGAPIAPGGWHHLAFVATPGLLTLYLDGAPYATANASLPALGSIALLGGDAGAATPPPVAAPVVPAAPAVGTDPSAAPAAEAPVAAPVGTAMAGFAGDIDELSIAKTARAAGFIRMSAISQGSDPSKLVGYGIDEETSTWLSGYFGVLIKAVTFDGWVVIGILLVMALTSWVVMVEKDGYLRRQKKSNATFDRAFRRLQHDLTSLLETSAEATKREDRASRQVRKHSALYRIYKIGAEEIRRRFPDDGHPHVLNAEAIAAIRAALDAGLVREMQALNRLMVLLTIAISGGPFLGLLGTVIGVMITFAAIAMSGDVNINAIAPGIAGALMATVAGLVVAIPALFGYNWLTIRIKDLTSDMQVFADEFSAKMAEVYSSSRPDPTISRIAAE